MIYKHLLIAVSLSILLAACSKENEEQPMPDPAKLTLDDVGHFCGMVVSNHEGPKGQVFLKGVAQPLWFVSVRDSLAFSRMPDEQFKVFAIYVSDMGKADTWEQPGDKAWVNAKEAWYVGGSSRAGGMGMAEWVPFSEKKKAEEFVAEYGGKIVRLGSIETNALLGEDRS